MKRIGVHLPNMSAVGLHRAILPVRAAIAALAKDGIEVELMSDVTYGDKLDALVIHRALPHRALEMIAKLKEAGTKIVWDTDDDLGNIPSWNPAYGDPMVATLWEQTAMLADERWASSDHLGKLVSAHRVLKNMVDPDLFRVGELPPKPKDARVSILWAGGSSHRGDLEACEDALDAILTDYRDKVTVALMGGTFSSKIVAKYWGNGLQLIEAVPMADFFRTLVRLQPDIGICPLAEHEFNKSKSNTKWAEYSMAGAAVVCSFGEAYAGIPARHPRDVSGWRKALAELIAKPDARKLLVTASKAWIREEYEIHTGRQSRLWCDAFRGLVEG